MSGKLLTEKLQKKAEMHSFLQSALEGLIPELNAVMGEDCRVVFDVSNADYGVLVTNETDTPTLISIFTAKICELVELDIQKNKITRNQAVNILSKVFDAIIKRITTGEVNKVSEMPKFTIG